MTSSCTFNNNIDKGSATSQNSIDIDIIEVSTPEHESGSYIVFLRYDYFIRNNTDTSVTIQHQQVDKIYDEGVEWIEPIDLQVISNVFILFKKDTIFGTPDIFGGNLYNKEDIVLQKDNQSKQNFTPNPSLREQIYREKYTTYYKTEKDFILDIVKEGVLCVRIGDSIYKVKNSKPLEYFPPGMME
jgi:hypothetical protein